MELITLKALEEKIQEVKEIYRKEIQEFSKTGQKFVDKEITNLEFKAASGGMGVYAQRGGEKFMIRLRIPSGVLDFEVLKLIQDFTKDYSLDYIHFTTRQAIQLHDLEFKQVIEIMERSLEDNLFTRGGGGNFPRNPSLSPLSGVEEGEAFDVTPYAMLINKYFISKMNTYRLPRKFKVAFSNSDADSANSSIADLGFLAVKQEGREYFKLYIGGSLGNNEESSVTYGEFIEPADMLYHIEAILSLFKEEGDYENKGKARLRFIVKRMGQEKFLECYQKHLKKVMKEQKLAFEPIENFHKGLRLEEEKEQEKIKESYDSDRILQKQKGYYTVVIHPKGGILKTPELNHLVQFMEKNADAELRLTMEESIFIRNLRESEAEELLELTKDIRQGTRLSKSISCIGVPICQIGIQSSQTLLANILEYFDQKEFTEDILPSLSISGCGNSCGRHQVSEIGFQGKKKRVDSKTENAYALYVGGKTSKEDTHFAKEMGDLLEREIPEFLYELACDIREKNLEFHEYLNVCKESFETLLKKYIA